ELDRFDLKMDRVRVVGPHGAERQVLEQGKSEEGDETLTIRRQLEKLDVSEGNGQGLHPLRMVQGEIFTAEDAALFEGGRDDSCGEFASIEGFAASLCEFLEGRGEIRQAIQTAGLGSFAFGEEN